MSRPWFPRRYSRVVEWDGRVYREYLSPYYYQRHRNGAYTKRFRETPTRARMHSAYRAKTKGRRK